MMNLCGFQGDETVFCPNLSVGMFGYALPIYLCDEHAVARFDYVVGTADVPNTAEAVFRDAFQSDQLELARCLRGLTRDDVAKSFGTTEYEIWNVERNDAMPSDDLLRWMTARYGFPLQFYSRESGRWRSDLNFWSSLYLHIDQEDVCQQCRQEIVSALCDAPGCDLRLGDNCRRRVSSTIDYCNEHRGQPVQAEFNI